MYMVYHNYQMLHFHWHNSANNVHYFWAKFSLIVAQRMKYKIRLKLTTDILTLPCSYYVNQTSCLYGFLYNHSGAQSPEPLSVYCVSL